MDQFFAMGGYGFYVWPSYILALAVMAGILLFSLKGASRAQGELDRLQSLRPRRSQRAALSDPDPSDPAPSDPDKEGH